jgi:hypothetical protein
VRRRLTHHANVVVLGFGFRLTPARRLAFRRTSPGFRLTPARRLAFRRTSHAAVAKTAIAPLPSAFAAP